MAILPIVKYPEPILKKAAQKVTEVNKQIRKFIDNMAETMYEAVGVGLAAPQVNQSLRIIVVDPTGKKAQQLTALVNPEIIATAGEISSEEG
ncbi:MAG: peptide deformylase, partial [Candidatus Desulfofervidus sp.]|nr:peptide deformylase [Candidatus Desulfofervidus sp.]